MSFRGISSDNDVRYTNAEKKLLQHTKFPALFQTKVDTTKVNMQVLKNWIGGRVTELLGLEDEVVVELVYSLLEERFPDPKRCQISLTGFLEKSAPIFMKELWEMLISAQESPVGIPERLLEAKKAELQKKREEDSQITSNLQRRLRRSGSPGVKVERAPEQPYDDFERPLRMRQATQSQNIGRFETRQRRHSRERDDQARRRTSVSPSRRRQRTDTMTRSEHTRSRRESTPELSQVVKREQKSPSLEDTRPPWKDGSDRRRRSSSSETHRRRLASSHQSPDPDHYTHPDASKGKQDSADAKERRHSRSARHSNEEESERTSIRRRHRSRSRDRRRRDDRDRRRSRDRGEEHRRDRRRGSRGSRSPTQRRSRTSRRDRSRSPKSPTRSGKSHKSPQRHARGRTESRQGPRERSSSRHRRRRGSQRARSSSPESPEAHRDHGRRERTRRDRSMSPRRFRPAGEVGRLSREPSPSAASHDIEEAKHREAVLRAKVIRQKLMADKRAAEASAAVTSVNEATTSTSAAPMDVDKSDV